MQLLITFTAIIAVCSAGVIPESSVIVQGPKTTIAGPSGTIHADTGAVIRTADGLGGAVAPTVAFSAPLVHSEVIAHEAPLISHSAVIAHEAPILAHSGVIAHEAPIVSHAGVIADHSFGAQSFAAPLLNGNLYGAGLYGSGALLPSPLGLYGNHGLNAGLYSYGLNTPGLYGATHAYGY